MSTVLWTNMLLGGAVRSDASDKIALHRHTARLDRLCAKLGVKPLSEFCDSTDVEYNLGRLTLPAGMVSTDELMAQSGTWVDADVAIATLEALLKEIQANKIAFGRLKNDHATVVAELDEALAFARDVARQGGRFNFAIVM